MVSVLPVTQGEGDMGQQHLTVRVTTDLANQIEDKATRLRKQTGEQLTRSDVIKMALESFTAKPKAKGRRKAEPPLGEIFLELVDSLEIERTMRSLTHEQFRAAILDHLEGADLDSTQHAALDSLGALFQALEAKP